jgi:hypothetical protein
VDDELAEQPDVVTGHFSTRWLETELHGFSG